MCFWPEFNNVYFIDEYCKSHQYTDNYDEASFIIIGSFFNKKTISIVNSLKCKKLIFITEPWKYSSSHLKRLVERQKYDKLIGCVSQSDKRIKFPLYLMDFNFAEENKFISVNNYVKSCDFNSKQFCCLINRHDEYNTRTKIYEKIKNIDKIICPGKLFNNTSNEELEKMGKIEYLKKFKFNICPENSYIDGYITEKLFHCCLAGSIPIYYGGFDDIDAKVFNKNRILFYDSTDSSIDEIYNKINFFLENNDEFEKFYRQDVFCETAFETCVGLNNDLINYFDSLKND